MPATDFLDWHLADRSGQKLPVEIIMFDADSVDASVPQAAYRLGYLTIATRLWQELRWELWETLGLDQSIELAVDQLDRVVLVLGEYIEAHVIRRIDKSLDKHREFIAWVSRTLNHSAQAKTCRLPKDESWDDLQNLAQVALSRTSPLRTLYEIGLALGQYNLQLRRLEPTDQGYYDLSNWPDSTPLIQLVNSLPHPILTELPWFSSMKKLADTFVNEGQSQFWIGFIHENESDWAEFFGEDCIHDIFAKNIIFKLDALIQKKLGTLGSDFTTGQTNSSLKVAENQAFTSKPSFVQSSAGYILLYEGRPARRVSSVATNVIQLFQAFENANWPHRIDDPFYDRATGTPHRETTSEAVRSANNNLSFIKFSLDGTGTGVKWTPENVAFNLKAEQRVGPRS